MGGSRGAGVAAGGSLEDKQRALASLYAQIADEGVEIDGNIEGAARRALRAANLDPGKQIVVARGADERGAGAGAGAGLRAMGPGGAGLPGQQGQMLAGQGLPGQGLPGVPGPGVGPAAPMPEGPVDEGPIPDFESGGPRLA